MKNLIVAVLVLVSASLYGQQQTGNAAVDSLRNEKDPLAVQQRLKKLESGTEKDMITVINYYTYNKSKKDSVINLLLQRFPQGDFAFNQTQRNMFAEDDAEKREKLFIKFKQQFPDRDMDQGYYVVSDAYARSKNLVKMQEYLDMMKNISSKRTAIGYNAQRIYRYDAVAADALLKPEIERLTAVGVPQEAGPKGRYYAFLYLYGDILIKESKYQEALKYIKEAYNHINPKSDHLNSDYALVMNKNGLHEEALPVMEKLLDDDKADAELKSAFVGSYEKMNPGKSAAEYLDQVDAVLKVKMRDRVIKTLVKEASPNFELKDIHGKSVSLADFKGKTIVLDFWATWCGPCKESFPSMQRVVNSYQKDPDVKFLFIHTLERAPEPLKDAKKYLSDNNYQFDLYMDLKDAKTQKNNAVTAFGAKGIPAKFIIDGKGNIRFKLVGFSGGDEDAVKELSAMIEIVKGNS